MRLVKFDPESGRVVDRYGSNGARYTSVVTLGIEGVVGAMHLGPRGRVGRHPAPCPQLFLVVSGSGWVSGRGDAQVPIGVGEGVVWEAGEEHESGTVDGLTAIIIEATSIVL
ncbi:MAG TPA: cupin [Acidimicrobiia bacterium]|nr:cupin [Acidimicrobiia bacterium]